MSQGSRRTRPAFTDPGLASPLDRELGSLFNLKSLLDTLGGQGPDGPDFPAWSLTIPGQGRARPPVAVDFAGTVNQEKPDPFASPEQNRLRAAALEKQAERNKETLDKAVFILSQSETGRAVLQEMSAEGYRIVFDDRRTGDRGAGGLCDPANRLIVLHAHDSPEYLALLLGHESVHAVQNTRNDIFPSSRHRPEAGIRLSFAIEADAYAQQTQIALELAYGDPAGPPDQVRYAGPARQMRERFPDIIDAAERVMQSEESLQNGATVAAAFQAFYDNFYLRTFYEDAHMDWAEYYGPRLKGSVPWGQKSFAKDVDGDWIKERIQHKGVAYLKKHAPHLDFNDARHSGVSEETGKRLKKFYKEFLPRETPPVLRAFGVHMKNAVAWVMGLTTSTNMVVKKGTAAKPPRRHKK